MTVNVGNLNVGAAATAAFVVIVAPNYPLSTIDNTASVSDNERTTPTVLRRYQSHCPSGPVDRQGGVGQLGENRRLLTYTLTASNSGPSDATGVLITDTLPAGLTYDSSSQGSLASGTLTVNVGDLAPGVTDTVTIVVTVASGTGSITNTANQRQRLAQRLLQRHHVHHQRGPAAADAPSSPLEMVRHRLTGSRWQSVSRQCRGGRGGFVPLYLKTS